jgi:uncharacterized membrane protein
LEERSIYRVFAASVLLKGFNALVECVAALSLVSLSTDYIMSWVHYFSDRKLLADPNDFIANFFMNLSADFSIDDKSFYAAYLFSHGAVKLVMVYGLLRGRAWAYPFALVAMAAFVTYQLYRYSYTHATGLLLLSGFDIFLMALISHEYRVSRSTVRVA